MANLVSLRTFTDARGNLTVIERILPFDIRRICYIYGVDTSVRGGHRHHRTIQAAICIQGSCEIHNQDQIGDQKFVLDRPYKCLILEPKDWHQMLNFSSDAILMVLASEYFDPEDYIYDSYR